MTPRSTRPPPRSRRSLPTGRRARRAESRGAGAEMATLTYMPTQHVPVLASELIELECETRFMRADFADALAELVAEGVRANLVYMDLGISSLQLEAAERG